MKSKSTAILISYLDLTQTYICIDSNVRPHTQRSGLCYIQKVLLDRTLSYKDKKCLFAMQISQVPTYNKSCYC